jgi:hypothetical protein
LILRDPDGKPLIGHDGNPELALNATQRIGAVANLANIADTLAGGRRDDDLHRATGGITGALTTFASLNALFPSPDPYSLAAKGVIAAGVGLGLSTGDGRSNRDQEFRDMQASRQRIMDAHNAEIATQKSIGTIEHTNRLLAAASSPQVRQDLGPKLQTYRRNPTYASRIGLVDTIERSLSSALVPRF